MLKKILAALALCFLTLPALAQGLIIGQPGQGLIIQNGGGSLVGGTSPITGVCPTGQLLYNNAGILGCQPAGAASITIGGTVTGGTAGYGLYVNGTTLGQFAFGNGVFTALGVNTGLAGAPVLFNGAGGTPSSMTLTNATGLPISTGVSGLGANVATALGSALNGSGAISASTSPTFVTPILGTPTSVTLTNATGLPIGGISATGTPSGTTYLRGDGTWAAAGGTTYTAGTGLTLTGSSFKLGDANLTYSGGALATTSLALGGATLGANALAVTGSMGLGATSTIDAILTRDAANALALQNGTNAQSLRVYNTWSSSGTNYERGIFDFQNTANVLSIGTQMGGTGVARNLQFLVGGVNKLDYGVTNAGSWTYKEASTNAAINVISSVINGNAGFVSTNSSSFSAYMKTYGASSGIGAPLAGNSGFGSDGAMGIFTNGTVASGGSSPVYIMAGGYQQVTATFMPSGLLAIGAGSTSSYPGIINSGAILKVRLADNSADAALTALSVTTSSSTLHTTSVALTNGAGASAGTLTNAPSVGNPTKWVPINDNGTTRYIPAW